MVYTTTSDDFEFDSGKEAPPHMDEYSRLRNAVIWSRQRLEPFRRHRYEFVREYVGYHYSEDGAEDRVPINLIELAVNTFVRQLVANNPKSLVTTRFRELKPIAYKLELALDHLVNEIAFGETMRRVVIDGLFGIGIVKQGLNIHADVEIDGFFHDVGQPFVDRVDLDDWVHDMSAREWEQVAYCGNRYRLPLAEVKKSDLYGKAARDDLSPTSKSNYNEYGDERVETISRGVEGDRDEMKEYVELWDFYLPLENKLVTMAADEQGAPSTPILREVDWDGPEGGPYRLLVFNPVPNSIMPLPPAATWMDLHQLANRLFRKMGRQGERQKTVLGIPPGAIEDAERIVKSSDGDAIRMDSPNMAQEFKFGGVEQTTLAFTTLVKDWFSYFAGNIDALGGLGPQHETFSGDAMLQQNASKRLADMQDRVVSFVKDVMGDLAYYLWSDPLIEIPIVKRVPNTDIAIPSSFSPEDREGDFLQYNINIEPYSMTHHSPGTRLQTIMGLFQNFLLPLAPMMQQQGIGINFEELLKTISKYSNMTELENILVFSQSMQGPDKPVNPSQGRPLQSPVTHRINERRNIPGASNSGKDAAMIQALFGAGQPDSVASTMRPTG